MEKQQMLAQSPRRVEAPGLPAYTRVEDRTPTSSNWGDSQQQPEPTNVLPKINVTPGPGDATVDYCLAHLKLLYAFHALKEDIGYADGLWGIWNVRAEGTTRIQRYDRDGNVVDEVKNLDGDAEARQMMLSQLSEKRWALFVARAVDRYEAWWRSMSADVPPVTEEDMELGNTSSYENFPNADAGDSTLWKWEMLPPLGR
jgi:hypothetical protein